MEFPFCSAVISVHAHATEDEQRVLDALRKLLPASVEVRKSGMKGHHGNPILAFEARINQKKILKELWQRVSSGLRANESDRLSLADPGRIDDACFFYLRFDKQAAYGNELVLTDIGNAIHLRLKILAFPAKREVALRLVEKFLEDQEKHEAEA